MRSYTGYIEITYFPYRKCHGSLITHSVILSTYGQCRCVYVYTRFCLQYNRCLCYTMPDTLLVIAAVYYTDCHIKHVRAYLLLVSCILCYAACYFQFVLLLHPVLLDTSKYKFMPIYLRAARAICTECNCVYMHTLTTTTASASDSHADEQHPEVTAEHQAA